MEINKVFAYGTLMEVQTLSGKIQAYHLLLGKPRHHQRNWYSD